MDHSTLCRSDILCYQRTLQGARSINSKPQALQIPFTVTRFAGTKSAFLAHQSIQGIPVSYLLNENAHPLRVLNAMPSPSPSFSSFVAHFLCHRLSRTWSKIWSSPSLTCQWHSFPLIHSVTLDYILCCIFLQTFHGSRHSKITKVPKGESMSLLLCILPLPCTLSGI